MKAKKLLILTVAFSLLGIGSIVAGSPWGDFKGFSQAKIYVNDGELVPGDVPAFIVNGEPVVPLKELARSTQSLVRWNSTTAVADVYKPNVHLLVGREVTKDGTVKQSFGKVPKGEKSSFVVWAQVDELKTKIHSIKIQIEDPLGAIVGNSSVTVMKEAKDSFWFPWPFEVAFDNYGKYRIKFLMKMNEADDFTVVSEKVIIAE
jgi:hypothetical protein